MYNVLLNGVSMVASLWLVRIASGSWLAAAPFAVFWGLGVVFSLVEWWQWGRFLRASVH